MTLDDGKHVVDAAAVTVAGATWLDYLPNVAAALSIVWLLMRIYDWVILRVKPKREE